MADNYTMMSMELKNLTQEQERWLRQLIEFLQNGADEEEWEGTRSSEEPLVEGVMRTTKKIMAGGDQEMCYGVDFYPSTIGKRSEDTDPLVIFMEHSGDLEGLVSALHEFSRHFKLDYPIGFEWAHTCSRMRPGEFGGGAVVIPPSGKGQPKWNSTGNWLAKQMGLKKKQ